MFLSFGQGRRGHSENPTKTTVYWMLAAKNNRYPIQCWGVGVRERKGRTGVGVESVCVEVCILYSNSRETIYLVHNCHPVWSVFTGHISGIKTE